MRVLPHMLMRWELDPCNHATIVAVRGGLVGGPIECCVCAVYAGLDGCFDGEATARALCVAHNAALGMLGPVRRGCESCANVGSLDSTCEECCTLTDHWTRRKECDA